jgi:hypothetical protein
MKKKNTKSNRKQSLAGNNLSSFPLFLDIAQKQQIENLKSIKRLEKMRKKYDKKFKEVFILLEQLIAKKK